MIPLARARAAAAGTAAALTIAGCGGGGSQPAPAPAPTGASALTGPLVSGRISLAIPLGKASVAKRAPKFVSGGAVSAGVSVNNAAPVFFDVSATSSSCTTVANVRSCTLTIGAPVGPSTSFAVSLFLQANGAGALLGAGSNSTAVVAGTPFNVTVGINPKATFATISVPNNGFQLGHAATATATFTFDDASGATITGSANVPNFFNPITLTSSDPHVTISPTTLTTPGQTATLTYDGSNLIASAVQIVPSVGGSAIGIQQILIPGLVVTRYDLGGPGTINPTQLVTGNDHKIWWTERNTGMIGRIDPLGGNLIPVHFPSGFGSGFPTGITAGGDGNIWYSNGGQVIARMTTSGSAPTTGPAQITVGAPGSQVEELMTDAFGNVWYVNAGAGFSQVAYVDATTFAVHTFGSTPTPNAIGFSSHLTLGQDNAMWFTENGSSTVRNIGRITTPANGTAGTYSEFPIANTGLSTLPIDITEGPDGKIWFCVFASVATNQFYANFSPSTPTSITEFANIIDPNAFANLVTIFAGGDGNIWMAEGGGAVKIPPANPTAAVTQFFTDNGQTTMFKCITGPDANLWCTAGGSLALGPGFINTNDGIITWRPR